MRPKLVGLALTIALAICTIRLYEVSAASDSRYTTVPKRSQIEGKLTISYKDRKEPVKHVFVFSEIKDSLKKRSVFSIGYVTQKMTKYYSFSDGTSLSINNNTCEQMSRLDLVPELSWHVDNLLKGIEWRSSLSGDNAHKSGISGLISVVFGANPNRKNLPLKETVVYRNVKCDVVLETLELPDGSKVIGNIYLPSRGALFNDWDSYYAIKWKRIDLGVPGRQQNDITEVEFSLDFYNVANFDNDQSHKFDAIESQFNVPVGAGCSEFMTKLPVNGAESADFFSMSFRSSASNSPVVLAYDRRGGLMRREVPSVGVTIWDIHREMMYNIVPNVQDMLRESDNMLRPCSIVSTADKTLTAAYRPYSSSENPLTALDMIVPAQVAYMGISKIRGLACDVYEYSVDSKSGPPAIFALAQDQLLSDNAKIVGYHVVLHSYKQEDAGQRANKEPQVVRLWPTRMSLYRKWQDDSIELMSDYDVYDFTWTLDGWDEPKGRLFTASECFDSQDEQQRLQLAIQFERVHVVSPEARYAHLLPNNKLSLEYELIQDVFDLFSISRLALFEYELVQKQSHILMDMVIADEPAGSELTYFGPGKLASSDAYRNNQVELMVSDEVRCVNLASHVSDVVLVVYCPGQQQAEVVAHDTHDLEPLSRAKEATCTAVRFVNEPTIVKDVVTEDSHRLPCQAFKFNTLARRAKATDTVNRQQNMLADHKFDFAAKSVHDSSQLIPLKGRVVHYELDHEVKLITIQHYALLEADEPATDASEAALSKPATKTQKPVRAIDTLDYSSEADCARVCYLDAYCRSYSYCGSRSQRTQKCLISSLDLRRADVVKQLSTGQASPNPTQPFKLTYDQAEYQLLFADSCSIHERNYLDLFRHTDEVFRLKLNVARQFLDQPSTFNCAKHSVELEHSSNQYHIALFAFCPSTGSCILDESLANTRMMEDAAKGAASGDKDDADGSQDDEVLCRVYRKKYQTYFNVSSRVLKLNDDERNRVQVNLALASPEQCARACWIEFGQVCGSFDYCGSSGECLINQLEPGARPESREARHDCLHYDRNLAYDELRTHHSIGAHSAYLTGLDDEGGQAAGGGGGSLLMKLLGAITIASTVAAFAMGMEMGRKLNDRLEAVTILRQSISAGAGVRAAQTPGFVRFHNGPDNGDGELDAQRIAFGRDYMDAAADPDAIALDEIRR